MTWVQILLKSVVYSIFSDSYRCVLVYNFQYFPHEETGNISLDVGDF